MTPDERKQITELLQYLPAIKQAFAGTIAAQGSLDDILEGKVKPMDGEKEYTVADLERRISALEKVVYNVPVPAPAPVVEQAPAPVVEGA